MKITNKSSLPLQLVEAMSKQYHKRSDYSVTELLKPIQAVMLSRKHESDLETDASDMIWSLFGSAVHEVLAKSDSVFAETYMTKEISKRTISGSADVITADLKTIQDYKTTSVWSIIYKSSLEEWTFQLNAYNYLLGMTAEKLQIVAILRDWQRSKAKYDPEYPQSQVVVIDLRIMSEEEIKEEMTMKVDNLKLYEESTTLPECNESERWAEPTKYACIKKGAKKATKLFSDEAQAKEYAFMNGLELEERKGDMFKRCEYCNASNFCKQYNNKG